MDENKPDSEETPEEQEQQDTGLSQTPVEESSEELTPLSGLAPSNEAEDVPDAAVSDPDDEDTPIPPMASDHNVEESTGYDATTESGYQTESYDTYAETSPYDTHGASVFASTPDSEDSPEDDAVTDDAETEEEIEFEEVEETNGVLDDEESESEPVEEEHESSETEDSEEADTAEETQEVSDQEPTHKLIAFLTSFWFMIPVILVGMGLRVGLYYRNPALWLDEGFLTTEFLSKTFRELLSPLDTQSAPVGFLLTVKSIVAVGGTHEYFLRAFPLLCSCAMLVAMLYLGRRSVYPGSITIALALAAVSLPLIEHGAEFKQYASDSFWAAVLLWACAYVLQATPTKKAYFGLGALGVIAVWMSHPVLFVAAGAGLVIGFQALLSKQWNKAGALALVGASWAGSFAAEYYFSLRHYASNVDLRNWHVDAFFMVPPERPWPESIKWVVWRFMDLFSNPMGMTLVGFGMLGFLLGIGIYWKQNRSMLLMFLLPIAFALGASYFGRYPFSGRFLMFATPGIFLITACGLNRVAGVLWQTHKLYAWVFIGVIFLQPVMTVANALYKEPDQGARPVVHHLQKQFEDGDTLYLYHWTQHEIGYYADQTGFEYENALMGITSRRDWHAYRKEIEFLKGNERVWLAFVYPAPNLSQGDQQYFETVLDEFGTQIEKQTWGLYSLYLYDMTNPAQTDFEPADWLLETHSSVTDEPASTDEMPVEEAETPAEGKDTEDNAVEQLEN